MPCHWLFCWFPSRRPAGLEEESLLFVWSEGALEFIDNADTLRPFTLYEYRVRAHNSRGTVESLWSSARTLEAPPQDLPAPWAQATGAHSVLLNWTKPESPNGFISQYRVVYQERTDDPTLNFSVVHAFTVTVRTSEKKYNRYLDYLVNMLTLIFLSALSFFFTWGLNIYMKMVKCKKCNVATNQV